MGHFLQFGRFYINLRRGWERNCSVQAVMKWKEKMVWRPQRDVDSESESKKREMVSRHHQLISVCSRTWKAAGGCFSLSCFKTLSTVYGTESWTQIHSDDLSHWITFPRCLNLGTNFLRHIYCFLHSTWQQQQVSEHVQVFEVITISLSERKTRSESGEALLAFLQRQRQPQQTRREVKSPLSKELAPSSTTRGNMTLDSIVEDSPFCNIQQGLRTP